MEELEGAESLICRRRVEEAVVSVIGGRPDHPPTLLSFLLETPCHAAVE
jgi:hypothetical protein